MKNCFIKHLNLLRLGDVGGKERPDIQIYKSFSNDLT